MRHETQLRVLLTVTACLLSVDIWTRLADRPMLASQVQAQSRSTARPLRGVGTSSTDGVVQRKEMIDLLKAMKVELVGLRSDLKAATITVQASTRPGAKTAP